VTATVSGTVAPGFESVGDAFRASLIDDAMGASLCVYLHGSPVVDLHGGVADARRNTPWTADTIGVIFSCTKGLMSVLAAMLVERGELDYEAPVIRYWPEFGAAGKSDVRVRHLLNHQAGLSATRESLRVDDILDWSRMTSLLAGQEPLWPPGSGYAYHALTHGWLVGELVRRITGKSVSAAFRDMISAPLNAAAWIGLPRSEFHRVSHLTVGPGLAAETAIRGKGTDQNWLERATTLGEAFPPTLAEADSGFNDPRLWAATIPGAGGITNAHGLAKIWSATVWPTDSVRLLKPDTVRAATKVQTAGPPVFDVPPPWSRWGMGFQLDSETRRYVTPEGFGHDGAGGQVGFAEPSLGLGFGYTTNRMEGAGDARATSVIDALRSSPGLATAAAIHAAIA
jgi:CubicO group peptidase (beta-lactamase class C family)